MAIAMLEHLPPTPGGHLDLAGDSEGFFDHSAFPWLEQHLPMPKRLLSTWLRSGFWDRGTLFPTTAGVPQGGLISPVISHMVLDGLEDVVRGGTGIAGGTRSTTCDGLMTLLARPTHGKR